MFSIKFDYWMLGALIFYTFCRLIAFVPLALSGPLLFSLLSFLNLIMH